MKVFKMERLPLVAFLLILQVSFSSERPVLGEVKGPTANEETPDLLVVPFTDRESIVDISGKEDVTTEGKVIQRSRSDKGASDPMADPSTNKEGIIDTSGDDTTEGEELNGLGSDDEASVEEQEVEQGNNSLVTKAKPREGISDPNNNNALSGTKRDRDSTSAEDDGIEVEEHLATVTPKVIVYSDTPQFEVDSAPEVASSDNFELESTNPMFLKSQNESLPISIVLNKADEGGLTVVEPVTTFPIEESIVDVNVNVSNTELITNLGGTSTDRIVDLTSEGSDLGSTDLESTSEGIGNMMSTTLEHHVTSGIELVTVTSLPIDESDEVMPTFIETTLETTIENESDIPEAKISNTTIEVSSPSVSLERNEEVVPVSYLNSNESISTTFATNPPIESTTFTPYTSIQSDENLSELAPNITSDLIGSVVEMGLEDVSIQGNFSEVLMNENSTSQSELEMSSSKSTDPDLFTDSTPFEQATEHPGVPQEFQTEGLDQSSSTTMPSHNSTERHPFEGTLTQVKDLSQLPNYSTTSQSNVRLEVPLLDFTDSESFIDSNPFEHSIDHPEVPNEFQTEEFDPNSSSTISSDSFIEDPFVNSSTHSANSSLLGDSSTSKFNLTTPKNPEFDSVVVNPFMNSSTKPGNRSTSLLPVSLDVDSSTVPSLYDKGFDNATTQVTFDKARDLYPLQNIELTSQSTGKLGTSSSEPKDPELLIRSTTFEQSTEHLEVAIDILSEQPEPDQDPTTTTEKHNLADENFSESSPQFSTVSTDSFSTNDKVVVPKDALALDISTNVSKVANQSSSSLLAVVDEDSSATQTTLNPSGILDDELVQQPFITTVSSLVSTDVESITINQTTFAPEITEEISTKLFNEIEISTINISKQTPTIIKSELTSSEPIQEGLDVPWEPEGQLSSVANTTFEPLTMKSADIDTEVFTINSRRTESFNPSLEFPTISPTTSSIQKPNFSLEPSDSSLNAESSGIETFGRPLSVHSDPTSTSPILTHSSEQSIKLEPQKTPASDEGIKILTTTESTEAFPVEQPNVPLVQITTEIETETPLFTPNQATDGIQSTSSELGLFSDPVLTSDLDSLVSDNDEDSSQTQKDQVEEESDYDDEFLSIWEEASSLDSIDYGFDDLEGLEDIMSDYGLSNPAGDSSKAQSEEDLWANFDARFENKLNSPVDTFVDGGIESGAIETVATLTDRSKDIGSLDGSQRRKPLVGSPALKHEDVEEFQYKSISHEDFAIGLDNKAHIRKGKYISFDDVLEVQDVPDFTPLAQKVSNISQDGYQCSKCTLTGEIAFLNDDNRFDLIRTRDFLINVDSYLQTFFEDELDYTENYVDLGNATRYEQSVILNFKMTFMRQGNETYISNRFHTYLSEQGLDGLEVIPNSSALVFQRFVTDEPVVRTSVIKEKSPYHRTKLWLEIGITTTVCLAFLLVVAHQKQCMNYRKRLPSKARAKIEQHKNQVTEFELALTDHNNIEAEEQVQNSNGGPNRLKKKTKSKAFETHMTFGWAPSGFRSVEYVRKEKRSRLQLKKRRAILQRTLDEAKKPLETVPEVSEEQERRQKRNELLKEAQACAMVLSIPEVPEEKEKRGERSELLKEAQTSARSADIPEVPVELGAVSLEVVEVHVSAGQEPENGKSTAESSASRQPDQSVRPKVPNSTTSPSPSQAPTKPKRSARKKDQSPPSD